MSSELAERLAQINELKVEYDTPVIGIDGAPSPCPGCGKNTVRQNDKVWPQGGVLYYQTLYYCLRCGHHRIGEIFWTTDY